jgi:hypothetical protein
MDVSLFIMNRHYRMATAGVYAEPTPCGSENFEPRRASLPVFRQPVVKPMGNVDKPAEKSANAEKWVRRSREAFPFET